MNGLTRWLPRLIIATATLHTVFAFAAMPDVWGDIARDGFFDAIGGDPVRGETVWFFLAGLGMFALGTLAHWAARTTGRIPAQIGGYLLLIGVLVIVFLPISGGWLLAGLGVLALVAARRPPAATASYGTDDAREQDVQLSS